ncbi:DinB family protein [uncultured Flavobacterium sp.]|uniref:DinB family protein n=1 Tax=uncultured Flavobacterium sp. TaxID=165435 RepID=UPI0025D19E03|nr:DinB family protein [uncultured Flavobacterium sp.]
MTLYFSELFEYTYYFNDRVIDLLSVLGKIPEKSLKLLNHTINAHEIWNARIENRQPSAGVWDIRPLESLKAINSQNYSDTLRILENFSLDEKISYVNSQGAAFVNTVGEILLHAGNHSTYHRGQIATDCKEHGITPLVTDYIFYKRQTL